ncbi:ribonuclease domain-containing protein [uncultured Corynebacterium sp.]|uniref:ribonuclease domain-containing protein n=1 Tax=uncultured Corynebacterium sp. TaxID=159447 RepID=UPI0025FABA2A|nr:ribonuclease domain-containing protein [uncultured Corynebacterium sp.]
MQKSGNKKVAGLIGAALILAAAWLGVDMSNEDSSDNASPTPSPASSPATSPEASPEASPVTGAAATTDSSTSEAQQDTVSDLPVCSVTELPNQADLVIADILAGGPYDYPDNDGVRFGNYEEILPDESSNYYREYTVETPGLNHRGPLRIVTGGTQETDPDVWYYTEDHYESFCEITDAEN